ncbi:hypothetical protein CORC01_03752 [Colletotrichum orchidophilum]|uniref:Integral membrane protein n=1 Tax=Colletotrichum orchidophilum TaxID=1209926 RepID=A0A1G4BHP8_9PEZI|nr:uncharacterized protein CORC01_03752 [Colletotrichum orchidophilum]OHF00924.1 hypothetical protein CORC01_03752 [Colletotrichum orchidophilum]
MGYMDVQTIVGIVFTVVEALAVIAGFTFFILLLRKAPRGYHDPIHRWVDITKVALGLWLLPELLSVIINIVSLSHYYFEYFSPLYKFIIYTTSIVSWILAVSQALTFLSLFYLARAFAVLRTDEASKRYRIGKMVSLAAVVLISLLSFTAMCLWLSINRGSSWALTSDEYERMTLRSLVAQIFDLVCACIHLACAIGAVTYVALVRKKALKGRLHKAANLALAITIVWLIRAVWMLFAQISSRYGYYYYTYDTYTWFNIPSLILGILGTLAVFIMLYLLATKDEYGLKTRGNLVKQTAVDDEEALGGRITTANRGF